MPLPAHLTLTGEKQNQIDGSCDMKGREKTILVYAMDHDIHIPRHPQSGVVSGKRIHGQFTILKEYDKSSPKLYQALCTGEHLSNVTVKWYRINKQGQEEHYFTHTLTDAIIVEIRPSMSVAFLPENEPFRHMEDISFTYKQIKWTWEPDGIEAEDSWAVPK
jgi:type VI secretion system secreted protein Hcp